MFNSKTCLAEYSDTSTLSARINHHCRLLATIKTAAKPLAAANWGGLHSFAGTPMSGGVGPSSNSAVPGQQPCPAQPSQAVRGELTAGEGDSGERAGPVGSGGVAGSPPPYALAGFPARAGAATASPSLVPTALTGQQQERQQEQLRGEEGGNGWSSPRSSHGQTTEDDMDDMEDDSDDGDEDKPDDEVEVVASADRSLQNRDLGGLPATPMQEDERQDAQQQQLVDALAAASSLGDRTRKGNDGSLPDKAPQVDELLILEDGHGHEMGMKMVQQHPKATEAEVKQHALRLLQSRLLLLTHASTCSEDIGDCRLAPLCDSVQQLLRHMQSCGNKKSCGFPHCKSSKAVLHHKHMCTDSACGLCGSVRDLSQKCFWANARHMHKRRLEESHEERRKKRQSEGKTVARPRKILAEKAKAGKECCSGLDEQGNDLGDISLGFFLRQDKAVKARKKIITAAQDNDTNTNTTATVYAYTGGSGLLPWALQQHGQGQLQREADPSTSPSPPARAQVGSERSHDRGTKGHASELAPSQACGQPAQTSPPPALASSPRSPRLGHPRSLSVSWSSLSLTASSPTPAVLTASPGGIATATGRDEVDHDSEDVSGGGFEASSVEASSGGGDGGQRGERKAAARGGGGLTVVIPPVGLGAVVGHLRSPSEIMLDDIAESLADTTRKPSFARMQSVQAFLDDHVELRESASFGDVSAMVEQWMSLEDTGKNTMDADADADNMDENGMGAFSF
ncbi:conserved unknown protein [Ectocarpus siliculosus]|uniref:histone acetyltransferase n=1 Tax=Ectocarpus siliculosus TaxID=2880 RepID=D8LKZ2_ECTSI|nr:conserved unknown protein [Ectocarpus siliculosus]|eukprot:CBN80125.1 conserved unknown protein [Ectocarpus siliculosus]